MAAEVLSWYGGARLAAVIAPAVLAVATVSALHGCDESADGNVAVVRVAGKVFHLELASDSEKRFRGLSGRTHIEADGGMLFVFPKPERMSFVMRECPIPIDILFLDSRGVVIAAHEMQPEEPRRADEPRPVGGAEDPYERRLKKYSSKFDAQFAVELAGGTIRRLGAKEGDRVSFDVEALKKRAK